MQFPSNSVDGLENYCKIIRTTEAKTRQMLANAAKILFNLLTNRSRKKRKGKGRSLLKQTSFGTRSSVSKDDCSRLIRPLGQESSPSNVRFDIAISETTNRCFHGRILFPGFSRQKLKAHAPQPTKRQHGNGLLLLLSSSSKLETKEI